MRKIGAFFWYQKLHFDGLIQKWSGHINYLYLSYFHRTVQTIPAHMRLHTSPCTYDRLCLAHNDTSIGSSVRISHAYILLRDQRVRYIIGYRISLTRWRLKHLRCGSGGNYFVFLRYTRNYFTESRINLSWFWRNKPRVELTGYSIEGSMTF